MTIAARRPLCSLALVVGLSAALVAIVTVTHRLSWPVAIATFYTLCAVCQVAYLLVVVGHGAEAAPDDLAAGGDRRSSR